MATLGLRCWVFVAAHELSLVSASGGYSSLWCTGFSLQWLLLLQSSDSRRVGFSSCGAWAQLLRGMWDLPGSGIEPVSPASAGRFSTTAPPGKSLVIYFKYSSVYMSIPSSQSIPPPSTFPPGNHKFVL